MDQLDSCRNPEDTGFGTGGRLIIFCEKKYFKKTL